LLFATNGWMFDVHFKPVGLYVENGHELVHLNTKPGSGQLPYEAKWRVLRDRQPNWRARHQSLSSTATSSRIGHAMLVINGRMHPHLIRASRKRRSGVGSLDPHTALFAISDGEVTFPDLARFFKCSNALFLDGGSVPSVYIPSQNRGGNNLPVGPMIAVFARANQAVVP